MVGFKTGKNRLRVVASKNGVTVSDEIEFEYQTAKWGAGVCSDSGVKNWFRFGMPAADAMAAHQWLSFGAPSSLSCSVASLSS
jgi:hypothetical protein